MKCALFAGRFDPVTIGHMDIITRAAEIFDTLHILVSINVEKNVLFSSDFRVELLKAACFSANLNNIIIAKNDGMTVDYAAKNNIDVLVRGIRDDSDLAYEMMMAHNNRKIYGNFETLFLPASQDMVEISASEVRRKLKNGDSLFGLVPEIVIEMLKKA